MWPSLVIQNAVASPAKLAPLIKTRMGLDTQTSLGIELYLVHKYTEYRKQAMSNPAVERRTRKRQMTRQAISDVATRLFFERGFDQVTIDEIAQAADVGRMTVFNHFPRKEDLFFDREDAIRDAALAALRERARGTSAVQALRALAHRLIDDPDPAFPLFDGTCRFVQTALASEALKARARQMRDVFIDMLAAALVEDASGPEGDPDAHLAAGLIAAAWTVAFMEAHKRFAESQDLDAANRIFLVLIDKGMAGVDAALAGTVYAATSAAKPA
ncbi:TetR/AcrR family transcriptional regulator [Sphingomonas sp. NFR04]|uniref:TetR/AcrR family transcriptional regulator n=1 Tax=Sphingomonas sp. NFR04 TaxID=1566283 RepID=UPI0020C908C9|nr:TetR/AcrR family transcriptional regulator [Sphingomonas sp. NFR04]